MGVSATFRLRIPLLAAMLFAPAVSVLSQYVNWFADITGESGGHAAMQSLTFPVSAAAMARGEASSVGSDDAADATFCPASMGFFDRDKFSITHLEWFMGLRQEHTAAAFPIFGIGTIGGYTRLFTVSGLNENSRDINEDISHPVFFEYSLGASFAREIMYKTLSAGLTVAYNESRLAGEVGRTVAANADVIYCLPWMRSRLYFDNIGPKVKYVATPEPLPMQVGLAAAFDPLALKGKPAEKFGVEAGIGLQKTADEPMLAGIGTEVSLVKIIKIRAGYEYPIGHAPALEGLSAGAGLMLPHYGVDAAWKYQSEALGSVYAVTASVQLDEVLPKTAEQLYAVAEKHFMKKRYRSAVYYAQKAIALDPKLWKAYALIERVNALKRRSEGLEIALIYMGNMQGQFMPVFKDRTTQGGLARQATVIRQLRGQFPYSLLVCAGNTITQKSDMKKATLADSYYGRLGFDAVALGSGEFGYVNLCPDAKLEAKMLCTNLEQVRNIDRISSKIVTAGKYKFMILSILGAAADPAKAIAAVNEQLNSQSANQCNLRIVVINDTWRTVQSIAAAISGADVIICGALHQYFTAPMKIGASLVLSPGDSGLYVGNLVMRFDDRKKLQSAENSIIPVSSLVVPDSAIEVQVQQIALSAELAEQGIDGASLSAGAIEGAYAFVSDRGGAPNIFLKVVGRHIEFPLTFETSACSKPRLDFASGTMAYCRRDAIRNSDQLWCMNIIGTQRRILESSLPVLDCAYSPDGAWIYFTAGDAAARATNIFRIRPDGADKTLVVSGGTSVQRDIAISPDGATMVFCAKPDSARDWQIYYASAAGEKPICITDRTSCCAAPKFSPDGAYISFITDLTNARKNMDIWIYNRPAGKVTQVTHQAHVADYCWLSDSKTLVFSSGEDRPELNGINLDAAQQYILVTPEHEKRYSEHTPRPVVWQGKPKVIYMRETLDEDKQIWWTNPDGSEDQLLTNSAGLDWLE